MAAVISAKITETDLDFIKKKIEAGEFLNRSDFMRQAIRDKIRELQLKELREENKAGAPA